MAFSGIDISFIKIGQIHRTKDHDHIDDCKKDSGGNDDGKGDGKGKGPGKRPGKGKGK